MTQMQIPPEALTPTQENTRIRTGVSPLEDESFKAYQIRVGAAVRKKLTQNEILTLTRLVARLQFDPEAPMHISKAAEEIADYGVNAYEPYKPGENE